MSTVPAPSDSDERATLSLLVVVFKITGESLTTSILVLCFILPSIPMGFVVGVVLDRTNKESVLVITSLLRLESRRSANQDARAVLGVSGVALSAAFSAMRPTVGLGVGGRPGRQRVPRYLTCTCANGVRRSPQ